MTAQPIKEIWRFQFILLELLVLMILPKLIKRVSSQSTTSADVQSCTADQCSNAQYNLDLLMTESRYMKQIMTKLKLELESQATQINNLRTELSEATSTKTTLPVTQTIIAATTSANVYLSKPTTPTGASATSSAQKFSTTASGTRSSWPYTNFTTELLFNIGNCTTRNSFVIYEGKIYADCEQGEPGLKIYNALNGQFYGIANKPNTTLRTQVILCKTNGDLFVAEVGESCNIWYANISSLKNASEIIWKLWRPTEKFRLNLISISEECDEIFIVYGSEVQIRNYTDGRLIFARNITVKEDPVTSVTGFPTAMAAKDGNYSISYKTSNGGDYFNFFSKQLERESGGGSHSILDTCVNCGLAIYDDGRVFVALASSRSVYFWYRYKVMNSLTSGTQIVLLNTMPKPEWLFYDPNLKLLGISINLNSIWIYRMIPDPSK